MSVFEDFANNLWQSTVGGILDSTMDSLGLSRHGRDQVVNQENALEQMAVQNQYAVDNWENQFNKTNSEFDRRYKTFQSPQAMVRQYNDIGLNPSAMLQAGQAGFGGTGASVNPTPVSMSHGSTVGHGSVSDSKSADYIDALSRMKLNDAQTQEIYSLLKGKIREQDDAHNIQGAVLFAKNFENQLNQLYGSEERARKLTNLVYEGISLLMRGKESEANIKLIEAHEELANDEHLKNKEEIPRLGLMLDALITMWKRQGSYYGAAGSYQSAMAKTENDFREFRRDILENERDVSERTLSARVDEIINKAEASDFLPENAKVALEMAKKENNLYYFKAITGIISDAVGTAVTARTGGRIASAMEVKNDIQNKIFEYNKEHGVTETATITYGKNGSPKETVRTFKQHRPAFKGRK